MNSRIYTYQEIFGIYIYNDSKLYTNIHNADSQFLRCKSLKINDVKYS